MADALKIEIDVSAAKAALDALSASFKTFAQNAEGATKGASAAITKLTEAMGKVKALDSSVLESLKVFNSTLKELNKQNLTDVNVALKALGGTAGPVKSTAAAIKAAKSALNGIKSPAGLKQVAPAFKQAGSAAKQADAQIKAFRASQRNTANAVKDLGTELLNAAGFITGLGVTAGKIVSSFTQIRSSGLGVNGTVKAMVAQFGKLGTVAAILSGIAIAMGALFKVAKAIISPIVQVSTQFQSFQLVLDKIDGTGAGAKTLDKLRGVAKKTATDIGVLVDSFTKFRIATKSAGLSADQSLKIFKQFSIALRATGSDTESTRRAMFALVQMFSKGKIQAEELRGQLGDSLPGALGFAAQATGKTTAEFNKLLDSGKLLAKDVIPLLGDFLESKFGDVVAAQAKTATGAMTLFANSVTELMNTSGFGNLGGIMAGVAAGFAAMSRALDSQAIQEVAATFGDLVGILTGTLLSALSGVVEGFTAIFDVAFKIAAGLIKLSASFLGIKENIFGATSAIQRFSGVFEVLGTVLGASVGAFVAVKAATIAYGAAVATVKGIIAAYTAITKAADATMVLFNASLLLTAAPLTALAVAVGVVIAAYVAFKDKVDTFVGSLVGLNSEEKKAADGNTAFADSVTSLVDKLSASPGAFLDSVVGAKSLTKALAEGKVQVKNLGNQLKANKLLLKENAIAVNDTAINIKKSRETIKSQIAALQAQKAEYKANSSASKTYGESTGGASRAVKELDGRLAQLKNALSSTAFSLSKDGLAAAKNANEIKKSNIAIEKQISTLNKWGVALSDSGTALATELTGLGLIKSEAVAVAQAYDEANTSFEDRIKILQKQVDNNDRLIQKLVQVRASMKLKEAAEIEAAKASNKNADSNEKIAARIAAVRLKYTGLTAAVNKSISSRAVENVKNITAIATWNDGTTALDALKQAQEKYGKVAGASSVQTVKLSDAIDKLSPNIDKTKAGTESAATATKKLGDSTGTLNTQLESTATVSEKTATGVKSTADALSNAQAALDTANTTIGTLSESFTSTATQSQSLSETLPNVSASLGSVSEAIGALIGSLPSFNEQYVLTGATTSQIAPLLPQIAESFNIMSSAASASAGPMKALVDSLTRIPDLAAGIGEASTSMRTLVETLTAAIGQLGDAAKAMAALGAAGDSVKTGFNTADTGADGFISKLSDVGSAISDLIAKMNDLKTAAEDALAAAQAAQSAGSGSGSGNRYGGFSEEAPANAPNVLKDISGSTPQFRDGTANTSSQLSSLPGGGIPSILHPNEAIVPLPKGRKIPVDLKITQLPSPTNSADASASASADVVKALNVTNSGLQSVSDSLQSVAQAMRDNSVAKQPPVVVSPIVNIPKPAPSTKALQAQPVRSQPFSKPQTSALAFVPQQTSPPQATKQGSSGEGQRPINVTITVQANDLDGFRRSEDQLTRELSDKIRRANRRNG